MTAPINTALTLLRLFVVQPDSCSPLAKFRAGTPQLPLASHDDLPHVVQFLRWAEHQLLKKPDGYAETCRHSDSNPATDSVSAALISQMQLLRMYSLQHLKENGHDPVWPTAGQTEWLVELYKTDFLLPSPVYLEYVRRSMASYVKEAKESMGYEATFECKFRMESRKVPASEPACWELTMNIIAARNGKSLVKSLRIPSTDVPAHGTALQLGDALDLVVAQCSEVLREVTDPSKNEVLFKEPSPEDLEVQLVTHLVAHMLRGVSVENRKTVKKHINILAEAL